MTISKPTTQSQDNSISLQAARPVKTDRVLGANPESRLASCLFGDNNVIGGDNKNHPLQSKAETPIKIIPSNDTLIGGDGKKAALLRERAQLEGMKIAPDDCWVEYGKMTKDFIKCWYRSKHPIFDGKRSRYLGKDDSPAAKEARQAIARRNRLRAIAKELKLLEGI